jgi:hypothetical protein
MLFTTDGIGEYLSGAILFDETLRQNASDGRSLPQVLLDQGVIPGIKVDKSTVSMPLSPEEKFTQASTAWARGSPSTGRWGPASPSGGRSSPSGTGYPRRAASRPTPGR